jgi:hypothetical protein
LDFMPSAMKFPAAMITRLGFPPKKRLFALVKSRLHSGGRQHGGETTLRFRGERERRQLGSAPSSCKVRLTDIEGSGRGWFATKHLEAGELIFEEEPARSRNVDDLAMLVMNSERLCKGLHVPATYAMRMTPPHVDESDAGKWSRSMAQVISNGFRSPDGSSLLLQDASLFNHSCRPNAAIGNPGGTKAQVRAIRDVKEGQEVCICYDSSVFWLPAEKRRWELKRRWGFECGCPRCVKGSDDEVEGKMTRIKSSADQDKVEMTSAELDRSDALVDHALIERAGLDHKALMDAAAATKSALMAASGTLEATHWRVRRGLSGLVRCLWLLNEMEGMDMDSDGTLDFDTGFEPGASVAELRKFLRIAMAVDKDVVPPLHPMRLEMYGMWSMLVGDGEEWKLGGALDDLHELKELWEGVEEEDGGSTP